MTVPTNLFDVVVTSRCRSKRVLPHTHASRFLTEGGSCPCAGAGGSLRGGFAGPRDVLALNDERLLRACCSRLCVCATPLGHSFGEGRALSGFVVRPSGFVVGEVDRAAARVADLRAWEKANAINSLSLNLQERKTHLTLLLAIGSKFDQCVVLTSVGDFFVPDTCMLSDIMDRSLLPSPIFGLLTVRRISGIFCGEPIVPGV